MGGKKSFCQRVAVDGDTITLVVKGPKKENETTFTMGVAFDSKNADGEPINVTPSYDGDAWIMDIKAAVGQIRAERTLRDDGNTMIWTMTAPDGSTWTRTFE